ncbi:MAG: phosphoenolpyruvate carboxylase [Spirochaetae bacterium HGW-Spirochaetae-5]|nr:MAG: phosphoenolpyruvate carboxylase [Spirochaetae bacterium HGW-Spirochaetae-5]
MNKNVIEQNFIEFVQNKFQFLNSVFLGLPLDNKGAGRILLEFNEHVLKGVDREENPEEIISSFFPGITDDEKIIDGLFQIIKYTEREVVLFDAVEDASFEKINNISGSNSLSNVIGNAVEEGKSNEIMDLLSSNSVRVVLTAHPTQFYPGTILGIINDLNLAIRNNNLSHISTLLKQLSFTPFFSKRKPTPYDEAISLIWYLENVFYEAVLNIQETVQNTIPGQSGELINPGLLEMGFWPGGDRDGNPFVTSDITLKVANRLRSSIIRKYYEEVRKLKRKLTFKIVYEKLRFLEMELFRSLYSEKEPEISIDELITVLTEIRNILKENYDGIYEYETNRLINTVTVFRYHFASLDIRQNNSVHREVLTGILQSMNEDKRYESLPAGDRAEFLLGGNLREKYLSMGTDSSNETLCCINTIRTIQSLNGEKGCNRYIISNCDSEDSIFELMALFTFAGWDFNSISVDIIPLFETITDLANAASIMQRLYSNCYYKEHLKRRNNRQTIMLGFSDGTKDGGYFTANWAIYKAKEALTALSREAGIELTFFDGRGGPAARGGGKTHSFYTSHGKSIENTRIHLTVQGQTISSNFGTVISARYNMEQLISASLKNRLYSRHNADFLPADHDLMECLSNDSFDAYLKLRNNQKFIPYLVNRSALPYFGKANIGSRPDKRGNLENFSLKDLRAIPFVGSWNLNKQNIPGFYGLGHALNKAMEEGKKAELLDLFKRSLFFRTLIMNSMMVLKKTNFNITSFMRNDKEYGELWTDLLEEYNRTCTNLLEVSEMEYLMQGNPKDRLSVDLREKMILPLCVIQQYALCMVNRLKEENADPGSIEKYTHMIIRSSYGIINAGRNSA